MRRNELLQRARSPASAPANPSDPVLIIATPEPPFHRVAGARETTRNNPRFSSEITMRSSLQSQEALVDRDSMGPRGERRNVDKKGIRGPAPPAAPGDTRACYNDDESGCSAQWSRTPRRGPDREPNDQRDHQVGQARGG